MKNILFTIINLFLLTATLCGQDKVNERVFVHLDKDCYLAGENIRAKFYVVDGSFAPSGLSTVGYIEICDTERPHIQYKVALENGYGSGKINIPGSVPTGIYELSGYTRFMRNEDADVFFRKQIAIINMMQESGNNRIELIPGKKLQVQVRNESVKVFSDKPEYKQREAVQLTFDGLPNDITDMVISVVRNDTITVLPSQDSEAWKKKVTTASPEKLSGKWLPEYEGHIINGKVMPIGTESVNDYSYLSTTIGFVGNDIRVLSGQIDKDGTVCYYTNRVYGPQELVTSTLINRQPVGKYRVDITSPFAANLPSQLPELQINPENNKLLDRFIGVQLNQIMLIDSAGTTKPVNSLYDFKPVTSYDLDQYTRFNSVRQTIVEFILRVVVRRIDGDLRLRVFFENEKKFNNGNTLVLLDGIPLFDHNLILNYNPYLIKKVDIYDGKYAFGDEFYDCMVSFSTYRTNLPSIQLGEESQLFVYDCPELPAKFDEMPDYSDEATRKSARPDFRHTLFWEPFAESAVQSPQPVVFYTSDLIGDFKIYVEGITRKGEIFYGSSLFRVEE